MLITSEQQKQLVQFLKQLDAEEVNNDFLALVERLFVLNPDHDYQKNWVRKVNEFWNCKLLEEKPSNTFYNLVEYVSVPAWTYFDNGSGLSPKTVVARPSAFGKKVIPLFINFLSRESDFILQFDEQREKQFLELNIMPLLHMALLLNADELITHFMLKSQGSHNLTFSYAIKRSNGSTLAATIESSDHRFDVLYKVIQNTKQLQKALGIMPLEVKYPYYYPHKEYQYGNVISYKA